MTVNQLECFRAVARRRHFAKAAATLGKTQPAISVQIQGLESELGVTLFERTGKQVLLTTAGEILLPYAERVLADTEEARLKMAEVHDGTVGLVRIGIIPTVAAHFLPAVLKSFRTHHPAVNILLREEGRTPLLTALLESNEIDLSVGLEQVKSNGLKSTRLITEEFCLGVSLDHPLAAQASVSLSKLKREKFILYKTPGHHNRETVLQFCRNAGFEPQVEFESEQAETIQYLVESNLGVTVLPRMVFDKRAANSIVMVRIESPTPKRTIVASWRTGRYLSLSARHFLQCAVNAARSFDSTTTRAGS